MMSEKKNSRDRTIEEIHRTRQQMAAKFGGDIAAILEDARKRQAASGRPIWQGATSGHVMRPSGGSGDLPVDDANPTQG
jgi:hypothetical protein